MDVYQLGNTGKKQFEKSFLEKRQAIRLKHAPNFCQNQKFLQSSEFFEQSSRVPVTFFRIKFKLLFNKYQRVNGCLDIHTYIFV